VTDLGELYASLSPPAHQEAVSVRVFSVRPIDQVPGYFVGRGANDNPALLIEIEGRMRAPIVLQNLMITFNTHCSLNLDREQRDTDAVVIECLSPDPYLTKYFLMVAGHLLDRLGLAPTADEVALAVDALVSLFQKLSRPPRREAQGLFGELIVIDAALDAAALLDGWHADPLDRFDFTFENSCLEVKTSASRQRCHDFSFEQCTPPVQTSAILASMFVETAGGGLSLEALVARLQARFSARPEFIVKLHAVVADALGSGLPQGLSHRFDEQLALSSLAFYDLSLIPAVRGPLPPGVTAVRFRSEIGSLEAMTSGEVASKIPALI
jgi:hypothetical protein